MQICRFLVFDGDIVEEVVVHKTTETFLLTLPRDAVELGLFLLPFGLPLGLFGVGDPLASCGWGLKRISNQKHKNLCTHLSQLWVSTYYWWITCMHLLFIVNTTGCYFKTNRWHAVIGCQKRTEYTADHHSPTISVIPVKWAARGQCKKIFPVGHMHMDSVSQL